MILFSGFVVEKIFYSKIFLLGSQEFLIVVQRTEISKISLDSPDYTIFKLPLQDVKHAIAIDYDPVEDFIYWTDDGVKIFLY